MHPILLEVGGWPVYSYGVLLALAYVAALQFAVVRARHAGVEAGGRAGEQQAQPTVGHDRLGAVVGHQLADPQQVLRCRVVQAPAARRVDQLAAGDGQKPGVGDLRHAPLRPVETPGTRAKSARAAGGLLERVEDFVKAF